MLEDKLLQDFIKKISPEAETVYMEPGEAVFEENVKMNCFYCGKYGNNWRCPPNLPNIDYNKMFGEFEKGIFIIYRYSIADDVSRECARRESSVALHHTLLRVEKWLLENNHPTAISFGAGSCKLCKGGCGKERCNNPYMARSPLEATGCNVIKTVKKYGVDVCFPAKETLMRIGLVLWQE